MTADLTEEARKLDEKLASQIGDDVSVIFSHEYLFKEARRVTAALLARLEAAEADNKQLAALVAPALRRAQEAEAKLARMEEALRGMEKAATEVARYGAQTGSQWSRLTVANLLVRAALQGETK